MPTISDALSFAKKRLEKVTDVASLEAEVLLADTLQVSRSYLHTWPEKKLSQEQDDIFRQRVKRREQGEPIAYLTGHREFWTLDLLVTPDVLIPRPETELLVETVLKKITAESAVIADLGTGSGAIALALAKEKPQWLVYATDASPSALGLAKINAERFNIANVNFYQGEWCNALPNLKFDAIVSNPPYLAEDDIHLIQGDLRFEPKQALIAAQNGLGDIVKIISQAKYYLRPGGFLMLEHGADQAKDVENIFKKSGYTSTNILQDVAGLDRITIATWGCF